MGKSDPYVYRAYLDTLDDQKEYESIGFYGFSKSNQFTDWFVSDDKNFYDLSLGNWNINEYPYDNSKKFDLIVCTRCAYFSKNPEKMMSNFHNLLKDNGEILIDWGLGDHWRYDNYKIGWKKNGEHESFYSSDNYLWSCLWNDELSLHPEFKVFEKWVEKLGYPDVKMAIRQEVPVLMDFNVISSLLDSPRINMLALWESSPQLYIILFGKKK